jgi:protein-disulfide isomerase
MKRSVPFLIIGVVLLLVVAVVWKLLRAKQPAAENVLPVAIAPNSPVKPRAATGHVVTMEEYGDYQCPPCGLLYPELKKIEKEYGGNLRIVFRHLPLTQIHKNALAAAHAAEAAARQNHFWEMHDRLYLNQKAWADEADARSVFVGYARELGLDVDRFTRDMDSREVDEKIAADSRDAETHGITGTPTLVLDGNQLRPEATTPEGIRRGIDFLLSRKASAPPPS